MNEDGKRDGWSEAAMNVLQDFRHLMFPCTQSPETSDVNCNAVCPGCSGVFILEPVDIPRCSRLETVRKQTKTQV